MWVEILGPSGSGKNKIVEFLSERYEVLPDYVPKVGEPPLATHLGYLIKRFLNSSFANRNRISKDLITVRGPMDSVDVYATTCRKLEMLSVADYDLLTGIKNLISDNDIITPDLILYAKSKKMSNINSLIIKPDETIDLNFFNTEFELYEKYVEKINYLVEIDMTRNFEDVKKDVDFNVSMTKAAKKMSIWQKKYYRD